MKTLHMRLAKRAASEGVSLNQLAHRCWLEDSPSDEFNAWPVALARG